MKSKMIYITDEMFDKLKSENASKLIDSLLRDYYKFNATSESDIKLKIEQLNESKLLEQDKIQLDIDKLKELKMKIIKQKEIEIEVEEGLKEKDKKFKAQFNENFKDLTGIKADEQIFQKFLAYWNSESTPSLYRFITSQKIEFI